MSKPKPAYKGRCDECGEEYITINPDQEYCEKHTPETCFKCEEEFIPRGDQSRSASTVCA